VFEADRETPYAGDRPADLCKQLVKAKGRFGGRACEAQHQSISIHPVGSS
jgi:hypothetical protein